MAAAGDVNNDGYDDVIVGAHLYDSGEPDEGAVWLYLGDGAGLDSMPVWIGESDQILAWFGHSVAGAGDVDGNGYADLVIGVPHEDHGETREGRAVVFHGLDVVPVSLRGFESYWEGTHVVVTWVLLDVTRG